MSRRTRTTQASTVLPITSHAYPPQLSQGLKTSTDKASTMSHRLSMTSNSSAGRRSSASLDGSSGSIRPSGIPRPTRSGSSVRPGAASISKPPTMYVSRPKVSPAIIGIGTRSAAANRSVEQATVVNDNPRIVTDEDLLSMEPTLPNFEPDHDSLLGMAAPYKQPSSATLPPRLIPELQALAAASQRRHTPAISTISTISSPSTQFSASPSPWSASTTNSTPTSWSSASPSLVQPTRLLSSTKRSQTVPLPSAVRTAMPKFPALQAGVVTSGPLPESDEPSRTTHLSTPTKTKKKTPRNSPAPTPPPRTSSVKRTRSRSNSKVEDSALGAADDIPPLPPHEREDQPDLLGVTEDTSTAGQATNERAADDNHRRLQEAISFKPPRPSRDGVEGLDIRRPHRVNSHCVPQNEQTPKFLDAAPIEALPQNAPDLNVRLAKTPEPDRSSTRQASRSRLGKFSKLALFSRSPKKTLESSDSATPSKKLQRRGPTAGTGHEGYRKFGRRGHGSSTDVSSAGTDSESSVIGTQRKPARATSNESRSNSARRDRASQSDLDDFAATRLKPVVILGGSQKLQESANSSLASDKVANDAGKASTEHANEPGQERHTSIASTGPLMRESRLIFHLGSLDLHDQPNLAMRRSQRFDNSGKFRLPQPIDTNTVLNRPYTSSVNVSQSSIAPTSAAPSEVSIESHTADGPQQKQRKKPRKLNWGFFRKKETVPEGKPSGSAVRYTTPTMAVRVSSVPQSRSVPHYAVLESENESSNVEEIEQYLAEAARGIAISDNDGAASMIEDSETDTPERIQSILLPSTPQFLRNRQQQQKFDSSQESLLTQPKTKPTSQPAIRLRQPRLAQVGRIPKVVPTTQGDLLPQTVSSLPSSSRAGVYTDNQTNSNIVTTPVDQLHLPNTHAHDVIDASLRRTHAKRTSSTPIQIGLEQLAPSSYPANQVPLKIFDRYSTTSSSSDGAISVIGPPLLPTAEFSVKSMRCTTTEDDVWNEYDDFLDRVTIPTEEKHFEGYNAQRGTLPMQSLHRNDKSMVKLTSNKGLNKNLQVNTLLAPPPLLFTSEPSIEAQEGDGDLQLRRSRIISALHSSLDPSSPFSIGDYLAEHGEAERHSGQISDRLSDSNISRNGPRSPEIMIAFPEPPAAQPGYKPYEIAADIGQSVRSKDPLRQSEMAQASLMVARWLSFGRVLFSPAHLEIAKQPGRHVLVVDGLGSEDWSIYCAVTYQAEQAYIYDLKEAGYQRGATSPIRTNQAPQNFRRREVANFTEAFNFPDNFFSVIVLRFPPVMADSKLKKIISECRRVLSPGGYMELMLLDLDIVNMGVLTRRALRNLKTKITMHDREVSLKPVIDNVQSVLHEKGFAKLSRCVVGVPVTGQPSTVESPTSSHSSGISDKALGSPSAGPRPLEGLELRQNRNFSLNDLVADHSDKADAKIGRAVSRTARCWWQHCFESAVTTDGNLTKSIFADKQVLNECKSRASSFKLLIAYTQKPVTTTLTTKRRTMSEPVVATLALAGTP